MKFIKYAFVVAMLGAMPLTSYNVASSQPRTTAAAASQPVGDFSLLDHKGYFHHMAWYNNNKAVVLLVQTNASAAARAAIPAYRATIEKNTGKPLVFFMLNALGEERAAVTATATSYGLDIPVLIDDAQIVAESLHAQTAGEAIVYNPTTFTIAYRGPTGAPLDKALDEILAGSPVAAPTVRVRGDAIAFRARDADQTRQVSYTRDVAPILAEKCAGCHRDGGIGPFAMDGYAKVQGWAPMIRETLMQKRMPPGQIDPHVGDFLNGNTITNAEQQKLIHWIDQGAKKDNGPDPLASLTWPTTEWAFGPPDLVIQVPAQNIPATGVLPYTRVTVPIGLTEDRYVRASQYVAGDRKVLHHTLNNLVGPGGRGDAGDAYVQPYVPGTQPYREPEGTGGLLRAGSAISLQLHYTPYGRPTTDTSRIGLWFYPKGEEPEKRMAGQCACIFPPVWQRIPANDPNFVQSSTITIPRAAYIHSFLPHMHFRGKYMRFVAHYPDGTSEELINIANYSYNWQITYQLRHPKLVPAGTKITATAAFDNSAQNLNNPDHNRTVPWGEQSPDEMFFGAVRWQYVDQTTPPPAAPARAASLGAGRAGGAGRGALADLLANPQVRDLVTQALAGRAGQ